MVDYEISVTDEYERLVEMFIRHGLEFSFDEASAYGSCTNAGKRKTRRGN